MSVKIEGFAPLFQKWNYNYLVKCKIKVMKKKLKYFSSNR